MIDEIFKRFIEQNFGSTIFIFERNVFSVIVVLSPPNTTVKFKPPSRSQSVDVMISIGYLFLTNYLATCQCLFARRLSKRLSMSQRCEGTSLATMTWARRPHKNCFGLFVWLLTMCS
jgi:hypothetical protein